MTSELRIVDTYTSLLTVNLRSSSDSGAIHLTGRRPYNNKICQWSSQADAMDMLYSLRAIFVQTLTCFNFLWLSLIEFYAFLCKNDDKEYCSLSLKTHSIYYNNVRPSVTSVLSHKGSSDHESFCTPSISIILVYYSVFTPNIAATY